MTAVAIRDLLEPFAESILAKASAFRQLALTPSQRARFREAISDDIKKCTNFIQPCVSRAALQEASLLGVNLFQMNWHDQPRFDPGRLRFHWEHMVPFKTIRDKCYEVKSKDEALHILLTMPRIVWVLKSEDSVLTQLGYRSRRPNPDDAYRRAGIDVVEPAV